MCAAIFLGGAIGLLLGGAWVSVLGMVQLANPAYKPEAKIRRWPLVGLGAACMVGGILSFLLATKV